MHSNNNTKTAFAFADKFKASVSAWARNYKQKKNMIINLIINWLRSSPQVYKLGIFVGKIKSRFNGLLSSILSTASSNVLSLKKKLFKKDFGTVFPLRIKWNLSRFQKKYELPSEKPLLNQLPKDGLGKLIKKGSADSPIVAVISIGILFGIIGFTYDSGKSPILNEICDLVAELILLSIDLVYKTLDSCIDCVVITIEKLLGMTTSIVEVGGMKIQESFINLWHVIISSYNRVKNSRFISSIWSRIVSFFLRGEDQKRKQKKRKGKRNKKNNNGKKDDDGVKQIGDSKSDEETYSDYAPNEPMPGDEPTVNVEVVEKKGKDNNRQEIVERQETNTRQKNIESLENIKKFEESIANKNLIEEDSGAGVGPSRRDTVLSSIFLSNMLDDLTTDADLERTIGKEWFELVDDKPISSRWVPWMTSGPINKRATIGFQGITSQVPYTVVQPIRKLCREYFPFLKEDSKKWTLFEWLVHDLCVAIVVQGDCNNKNDFDIEFSDYLENGKMGEIFDGIHYNKQYLPESLKEHVVPFFDTFIEHNDELLEPNYDDELPGESTGMITPPERLTDAFTPFVDIVNIIDSVLVVIDMNPLTRTNSGVIACGSRWLYKICRDTCRAYRLYIAINTIRKAVDSKRAKKHNLDIMKNQDDNSRIYKTVYSKELLPTESGNIYPVDPTFVENGSFGDLMLLYNGGNPCTLRVPVDSTDRSISLKMFKPFQIQPGMTIGKYRAEGLGVMTTYKKCVITAKHVIHNNDDLTSDDFYIHSNVDNKAHEQDVMNEFKINAALTSLNSVVYILIPGRINNEPRLVPLGYLSGRVVTNNGYMLKLSCCISMAKGLSGSLIFNSQFKPIGVLVLYWGEMTFKSVVQRFFNLPTKTSLFCVVGSSRFKLMFTENNSEGTVSVNLMKDFFSGTKAFLGLNFYKQVIDYYKGIRNIGLVKLNNEIENNAKMFFPMLVTNVLNDKILEITFDLDTVFDTHSIMHKLEDKNDDYFFSPGCEHDWVLRYSKFYSFVSIMLCLMTTKLQYVVIRMVNANATDILIMTRLIGLIQLRHNNVTLMVDNSYKHNLHSTDNLGVFFGSNTSKNTKKWEHNKDYTNIVSCLIYYCFKVALSIISDTTNNNFSDLLVNVSYIRHAITMLNLTITKAYSEERDRDETVIPTEVSLHDIIVLSEHAGVQILNSGKFINRSANPITLTMNFIKRKLLESSHKFYLVLVRFRNNVIKVATDTVEQILNNKDFITEIKEKLSSQASDVISRSMPKIWPFKRRNNGEQSGLFTSLLSGNNIFLTTLGLIADTWFYINNNNVLNVENLVIDVLEPFIMLIIEVYDYLFNYHNIMRQDNNMKTFLYFRNLSSTIIRMIRSDMSYNRLLILDGKLRTLASSKVIKRILSEAHVYLTKNQTNRIALYGDSVNLTLVIIDCILTIGVELSNTHLRVMLGLWAFTEQTVKMQGKISESLKRILGSSSFLVNNFDVGDSVIKAIGPMVLPILAGWFCFKTVRWYFKWQEMVFKQLAAEGNKDSFKKSMDLAENKTLMIKDITLFIVVLCICLIKIPTNKMRIFFSLIASILGYNGFQINGLRGVEATLLSITALYSGSLNLIITAIVWYLSHGSSIFFQVLNLPLITYLSESILDCTNTRSYVERNRDIKVSENDKQVHYLRKQVKLLTNISLADGSNRASKIRSQYMMFAAQQNNESLSKKLANIVSIKLQQLSKIMKIMRLTGSSKSDVINKIINSDKFYVDDEKLGSARSLFHVGNIPFNRSNELENDSTNNMSKTFTINKRMCIKFNVDGHSCAVLTCASGVNNAIGLRRRTQATPKALRDWCFFLMHEPDLLTTVLSDIIDHFRDNKIISKTHYGLIRFLFIKNIKKEVTPAYLTSFVTGIKKYRALIKILFDSWDFSLSTIKFADNIHNCFVKDEMVKKKKYRQISKELECYSPRDLSGNLVGNIPRIIVPAESYMRYRHFYTQSFFNDCLLLSRLCTAVKIGVKTSMEWPFIVDTGARFVVSIDITSFDGNQHRGLDMMSSLIRECLRVNDNGADVVHGFETSWKIIIDNFGSIYELFGSQASGDINTSSGNSIRLMLLAYCAIRKNVLQEPVSFICQGDNAIFQSNYLNDLMSIINSLDNLGLPVKIEGICDNMKDTIKIPSYLGAIGIQVNVLLRMRVNGQFCRITLICPWRDFDRYIPKIMSFNTILNERNTTKRTKEKIICWLATYATDLVLWNIASDFGVLRDYQNVVKNIRGNAEIDNEYSGHENIEDIRKGPRSWLAKAIGLKGLAHVINISINNNYYADIVKKVGFDFEMRRDFTSFPLDDSESKIMLICPDIKACSCCYNLYMIITNISYIRLSIKVSEVNINNKYDTILFCCQIKKRRFFDNKIICATNNFWDCRQIMDLMAGRYH